MAAVSVKIHGLDVTLSTDANYGNLPVLLEVPEISSARFKIGDPVSSDQSTSLRCASTPELRQKLLQVSTDPYDIPRWLAYPMRAEDTTMLITNGAMVNVNDYLWIRSEKMQITAKDRVSEPTLVTHGLTRLTVTRALDGTPRGSYQMDDFDGVRGPIVSIGPNAFPSDVIGLWVTMRIHRDHSEKCLNPSDPGHNHLNQPCSREVFTGRISRIADAGDVVEVELQSGIQIILDTAIPKICGISPVSNQWRDDYLSINTDGVRISPMFAQQGMGNYWANPTAWKFKFGPWRWQFNTYRVIFNVGAYLRDRFDNAGTITYGEARKVADELRQIDPPVYRSVPEYPIQWDNWNAIVVEGSSGFTGISNPEASRRDASADEYSVLAVSHREPDTDLDKLRTTRNIYNLGTPNMSYPYSPIPCGWYYPSTIDSDYSRPDIARRTGRLDGGVKGGAEYRNPGVMRSGSYYKAYEWKRCVNPSEPNENWMASFPGIPTGTFSTYVLGQLWRPSTVPYVPNVGAATGSRFSGYVDWGLAPPSDRCIDFTETLRVFRRIDNANLNYFAVDPPTLKTGVNSIVGAHALPYGVVRKQDVSSDTNVWLPETWVGRTLKDTVFTDQFQMNAVGWAPGKNGLFRPIWLADPSPEIVATITDDLLRDRDVTLETEGNIPIGEVEITGSHASPLNPYVDRNDAEDTETDTTNEYIGGATATRIISSDLLYSSQGRKVSIKMTNYLARDGLPVAGNAIDGTGSGISMELQVPLRINRYVEDTWRRVVNRFGSPVPSVTVRLDGDVEVYPGDYVHLSLSQIKDRNGRLASDHPIVAMCVERGDRLDDATAEVEFLLVGWYTTLQDQWHPGSLFGDSENGVLWEPFRRETTNNLLSQSGDAPVGVPCSPGDNVCWVADLSGNDNHLLKKRTDSTTYPYPTYNNQGIKFERTTNWLVSKSIFNATLTSGITVATVYFKDNVNEIEILSSRAPGGITSIPTVLSYPDPLMPWQKAGFAQYAGFGTGNTRGFGVRMKDPAYATTDPSTLGTHSYKQYLQAGPITSWNGKISTARYTPGTPSTNGVREYNMDGTAEGSIIGWTTDPAEPAASVQPINSTIRMGGMYSGYDVASSATVRFALVINRVITPAERAQLEAYMRWVASI